MSSLALLLPCIVLLLVANSVATSDISSMEIVVLRYKSLYLGSEYPNGRHEFRVCDCSSAISGSPVGNSQCVCSKTAAMGDTVNKAPVLYSTSCVHNPTQANCLVTEVGPAVNTWKLTSGQLYMAVSVNGRPLSSPEWQPIPLSKSKTKVSLTCTRATVACTSNAATDCHHCLTGQIEVDYVVVFKSLSSISDTFRDLPVKDSVTKAPSFPLVKKGRWRSISRVVKQPGINWHPTQRPVVRPPPPPPPKNTATFGIDTEQFRALTIQLHNTFRAKHGVAPLQHDPLLDRSALQWAQHLAAKQGCLEHQKTDAYGENLYYYGTVDPVDARELAELTVEAFYEEGEGYDYTRFNRREFFNTGHFTQLVWKQTQRVGVALAATYFNGRRRNRCQPPFAGHMIFVVFKYDPPGNVQSEEYYLDNVLRPRS